MKTLQVLLLVFVVCGMILVGSQIARRLLKPSVPPVAPADGNQGNRRITDPSKTNPIAGNSNKSNGSKSSPEKNAPVTPRAVVGQISFAEDAAYKKGDFWLEQSFELSGEKSFDGKQLIKLFVGLDDKTMRSLSVTLSGWELVLESNEGKDGPKIELARQKLAKFPPGEYDLGVLWRRGELSVWIGPVEIMKWIPTDPVLAASMLKLDSAAQVLDESVNTGSRRALAFNSIRFDDNFMRAKANDVWKPASGKWELTSMAFAERSANPFSLRVAFGDQKPFDDEIYGAEKRTRESDYGIGVQLSYYEGTLHVVRLTGGSPAAHAGLAEDDIFIEVNGMPVSGTDIRSAYQQLMYANGDLHLKMYRPGEKAFREYTITRDAYRWGVSVEAEPIPPTLPAATRNGDEFAFITAGESGWSDYEVEVAVKPLGSGGFGLAVATISDKDYILFLWRGPRSRGEVSTNKANVLQLVRVKNGEETILAEKPAHYRPYEFYRVGINWTGDTIKCMIDKNELLTATIPDAKRGKIGLYAVKGDPVFFDDVHVAGDRTITAAWHQAERSMNTIFAHEDDMEVWANPALEFKRDIKTGWSIHNQRFPGEQAISLSKPRFNELQVVLHSSDNPDDPTSPRLTIREGIAKVTGEGIPDQRLEVGAGPYQNIHFAGKWLAHHLMELRVKIDGKELSTAQFIGNSKSDASKQREIPTRVAIKGLKNLGDPNTVHISSSGTMEYSFDNAPSDWKVVSGRWGLLNKWICDPRWSWFGGRTKTCAAIWNKHIFSNDLSVDAHVALLMTRDNPPFERPGDFNLAICGDGVNLDSGYTLIFGGDINSWTRLYRKGVLVAEATKEEFRVHSDRIRHPDKPDLHQRWFHLKLEKIGNTVFFYRDGAQAFKFVDPDPIQEGRVGFWTMDNSFLISRVRIAHGGARPAPFEDGKCERLDDPRAVNIVDGEIPTTVTRELLPPEIAAAMEVPPAAFKSVDGIAPMDGKADNVNPGKNIGYHLVNGIGGGPFALQFRGHLIDVERDGVIRFAYKIDPGAMIDFYLVDVRENEFNPRHKGCYRWRLSGLKEDNSGIVSNEFAPLVGEIPGAITDGKWHAIQFDLQPTWRQFWRKRGYMQPARFSLRPMFGNLDNTGYLLAGMNGNHAGATYSVTDVKSFDASVADKQAPGIARLIWPFDADGDGHSIVVQFNEPGGSGVVPESISATLNGQPLNALTNLPDGRSAFDAAMQTLQFDLNQVKANNEKPFLFTEGTKYTLAIAPKIMDRAGNASPDSFTADWIYRASDAQKAMKAVATPIIAITRSNPNEMLFGDRPMAANKVFPVQPHTRVQASKDAPPWAPFGQKSSIEVVATDELPSMGFQMRGIHYDLQNWPYLDLDYKVPCETPFNLHLITEAQELHALLLVDVEDGRDHTSADISSRFGPPADFVADGAWRHSTIPLLDLFSKANPRQRAPKIAGLSFHDQGWQGGRRGLHYWIYRVQPVPAGTLEDISAEFTAADVTGITEFESSVDSSPTNEPIGKHELVGGEPLFAALAKSGKKLTDGWNFIHVRAKNGAGIWSEAAHRRFFLDTTPPRIARTEPADGGTLLSQTIRVFLEEEHGIDESKMVVKLDDQPVTQFVEFDPASRVLKFNARASGMILQPGVKMKMEINGLADRFGNIQTTPYVFSFTYAPKQAVTGPEMHSVTYHAATQRGRYRQYDMELSFGLSFEEHIGHVHAMRDCKMEWLNDPALAAEGNRALRFTCLQDDGDPQIMLHKNPWVIDKLPLLHFDYKADPGFKVDLHVEVFGTWYSIRFLGAGHAPNEGRSIGSIPGVVADGTWRHASVDLRALLDDAKIRTPDRIINKFVFSANGEDGCTRGSQLSIDNLDMVPPMSGYWQGGLPVFKWSAEKTLAEIAGYSVIVDADPTTIPPERIMDVNGSITARTQTGTRYVHVRACDQAGNWGPDKTIRLEFGQPGGRQPYRKFEDDN